MSTNLKEALTNLMKARWFVLDAEMSLNQLGDYVLHVKEIVDMIDENLNFFLDDVKKLDEFTYRALRNKSNN